MSVMCFQRAFALKCFIKIEPIEFSISGIISDTYEVHSKCIQFDPLHRNSGKWSIPAL